LGWLNATVPVSSVIESEAFGPLTAALRRAEATGHDVELLIRKALARRSLDDAHDIAAVLHERVHLAAAGRGRGKPHLIAGLFPEAIGRMDEESRTALDERQAVIEARATALAEDAVRRSEPWLRWLGEPPTDPSSRKRWMLAVRTVAAYRDRYRIEGPITLGPAPATKAQKADADRARAAVRRAEAIATEAATSDAGRVRAGVGAPAIW
jgi:hypothetical protein